MRKALLVISLLIFVLCGIYLGVILRPDTSIPIPKSVVFTSTSSSLDIQSTVESELTVYEKYHELHEQNNDLVGWIKIDGTRIDYPVMQTKDENEFYLRRNFKKENSRSGLPFVDNRCNLEDEHTNIVIYGHNMINGTMFSDLLKYDKASFCEKNSIIKYDTLDKAREYQIFAAFYTQIYPENQDVFKYYHFFGTDDENIFNEYVKNVKQLSNYKVNTDIKFGDELITLSNYKVNTDIKFGDELITLSTCGGVKDVGRFVVVAKRIK